MSGRLEADAAGAAEARTELTGVGVAEALMLEADAAREEEGAAAAGVEEVEV